MKPPTIDLSALLKREFGDHLMKPPAKWGKFIVMFKPGTGERRKKVKL